MNLFNWIVNIFNRNKSKDFELESKDITQNHILNGSVKYSINVPGHEPRTESSLFRQTKKHLVEELDTPCWICGSKEGRQVHHYFLEWSLANACDFNKLKLDHPNFPDWNKIDQNNPDTYVNFVDSPYNMMVLCQEHHTGTNQNGKGYGIHYVPLPIWVFQKYVKDGFIYTNILSSKDMDELGYVQDLSEYN
jgi:hypothetical protein